MTATVKRIITACVLTVLIAASLLTSARPAAAGASIRVDSQDDQPAWPAPNTNICTLRYAIIAANENRPVGKCAAGSPGLDSIFVPGSSAPYSLKLPLDISKAPGYTGGLYISESLNIAGVGPGANGTDVNMAVLAINSKDRVFKIHSVGPVTISNMKIRGGENVLVGGGIYVDHSPVTLDGLEVTGNHATSGGGIYISSGSVVTIKTSSITTNTASDQAGGILNEGTVFVRNSLLNLNVAKSNGGLDNNSRDAWASRNGSCYQGCARVVNSTITQNAADPGNTAGISSSAWLEVLSSTIVYNTGIGLEVKPGFGGSIKNSIIAAQRNGAADCLFTSPVIFQSAGNNIDSTDTCGLNINLSDKVNVTNLGLANQLSNGNGKWPTLVYELDPSSPAVDAGNNFGCPINDQRLFGRPAAGTAGGSNICDIGAFELGGAFFSLSLPMIGQ